MSSTSAYTPAVIHTTYCLSESHRMYAVACLILPHGNSGQRRIVGELKYPSV